MLRRLYSWLRSLLPEIIAGSRKGLIWFTTGGCAALLQLLKALAPLLHWPPDKVELWSTQLTTLQSILLVVAGFWTTQIAHEDAAMKTGLPPPPVPAPVIEHEIKR